MKGRMNITIIGLGGIGSPLALYLGRMCPDAHFALVDHDIWEERNAVRCPLTREGWNKASHMAHELEEMGVGATSYPEKFPCEILQFPSLIVACTDNLSSRRAAYYRAKEFNSTYVYAGNTAHVATAWLNGPGDFDSPRDPKTWFKGWEDPDEPVAPSCTAPTRVEQTAACNLMAASLAVWLIDQNVKVGKSAPWKITADGGNGVITTWRD